LKKYGKNYVEWSYGLKKCGYATDKKYPEKLIKIIKKYRLHEYDK
jgi:flagellum-specific peptidoglycan hydrolase FlgJ